MLTLTNQRVIHLVHLALEALPFASHVPTTNLPTRKVDVSRAAPRGPLPPQAPAPPVMQIAQGALARPLINARAAHPLDPSSPMEGVSLLAPNPSSSIRLARLAKRVMRAVRAVLDQGRATVLPARVLHQSCVEDRARLLPVRPSRLASESVFRN